MVSKLSRTQLRRLIRESISNLYEEAEEGSPKIANINDALVKFRAELEQANQAYDTIENFLIAIKDEPSYEYIANLVDSKGVKGEFNAPEEAAAVAIFAQIVVLGTGLGKRQNPDVQSAVAALMTLVESGLE